jgi:hypothetical protein
MVNVSVSFSCASDLSKFQTQFLPKSVLITASGLSVKIGKIEAIRLVSEGLRFEVIEVDELAGVESYFTKRAEKGDTRPVIVVHEN